MYNKCRRRVLYWKNCTFLGTAAQCRQYCLSHNRSYDEASAGQPALVQEVIAKRIIKAAMNGERDPARLRNAGLAALGYDRATKLSPTKGGGLTARKRIPEGSKRLRVGAATLPPRAVFHR
jgi:hypothetical protein